MDTKWKNTENNNDAKNREASAETVKEDGAAFNESILKKNLNFILGGLLIILGLAVIIYVFYRARFYISSSQTWRLGISANVAIGAGLCLILPKAFEKYYGGWLPQNSDFYYSWKETWKRQHKKTLIAGGIAMAIAVFNLNSQIKGGYFSPNFAPDYMLVATVAVQLAVTEFWMIKFMRGRLDILMDCVNEINKERLREAVELEKKSIEKAAKSERLKIDLISNVSHDLKTPLTSMVGYLELLKKEELGDVSRDYVEVISDKAEKLKEMIESLFSISKASSGNIKTKMEPIELNRLIEQIFADMDDSIAESGLQFVMRLTEDDTRLTTDSLHMYRICQNLIENSLKYSAPGTRVFVKTFIKESAAGKRVYLEITNTAGYLMDFDKEEIVERFARGDKARSGDGNGLGLAIVSAYAGALGGSFDINLDCDQFKAVLSFPADVERTEAAASENRRQA